MNWHDCQKGITSVSVRLEMSQDERAKKSQSGFLVEFEAKVRMHQGSVSLPILHAVVVDVVTKLTRGVLRELVYADDITLMSEISEGLRNMLRKRKDTFESNGFKVNLGEKNKMTVSTYICIYI